MLVGAGIEEDAQKGGCREPQGEVLCPDGIKISWDSSGVTQPSTSHVPESIS